jgi:hypothetical protein
MKRLRKGHSTVLRDARGHPRDATGHRTDLKPVYSTTGQRLWRAEELAFSLGERVRAVKPDSPSLQFQRMAQGECGTIMLVPEFTRREYYVLPDSMFRQFMRKRSGEFLARMPEHHLEPE